VIDKTEIEKRALDFEIHPANVQRDYVFGWLLHALFTQSTLKDRLFLKGGNALRKGYFANTRFSGDLDFGIPNDITQQALLTEVNNACDLIQSKAGIHFAREHNNVREKFSASEAPPTDLKVYEVRVYFKDFYGHADHIKLKISMDLTRFDKVFLPIQRVPLIHHYSDTDQVACEIRCVKLEELIASKLKCLLQRQHAPDLFDYAYATKLLGGTLDKGEVVRTLIRKTIFSRNPFSLKCILKGTAFDYFKETWGVSVICAKQFLLGAEEAIATLLIDLDVLFEGYPDNRLANYAYFGPSLREPIMQAGRTQTLLRIRYKEASRLVEAYSLKYLQKKDGTEREYLYVYNRTGGESEPGIRSLVAENFQSIENTDEKFVPRFPIELCKAGEVPSKKYLFDPNKPASPPRVGLRRRISSGLRYIYACSYCGRKFARANQSSILKAHKDNRGYSCAGRTGYYHGSRYS
jgi:predicted nucleotidyltransferase component of viral defense system